jgi:hypothetical protein
VVEGREAFVKMMFIKSALKIPGAKVVKLETEIETPQ